MKTFIVISVFLASICRVQSSSKPADWSAAEIQRTKSKLWSIFFNPTKYVDYNKKPDEKRGCGSDCWHGCEDFSLKKGQYANGHSFCDHCDDVASNDSISIWWGCCTGWCTYDYNDTLVQDNQPAAWVPTPAKVIRLVFHDCMRYEDGSGGCDGCLNWKNMGIVYRKKGSDNGNGYYAHNFPDPSEIEPDNNGLHQTVLALEHVYNDPTLADTADKKKGLSLQASGKSRADLWALAGIVAVEYSANENNLACEGKVLSDKIKGCGRRDVLGPDCKIQMPKIDFFTGRTDCNAASYPDPNYDRRQDFKTFKKEKHPDAHGNGDATLNFFATEFNLTPREATALMGAHTLGELTQRNAFQKYFWTRGQHAYLSNQYYKSLAGGIESGSTSFKTDFAIQCLPNNQDPNGRVGNGKKSVLIGAVDGSAATVSWTAHARGWFDNGGPFSWKRNLDMCMDGQIGHSGVDKLYKKNQNSNPPFTTEAEVWDSCWDPLSQQDGYKWTCPSKCYIGPDFVDEVMLNPDMGLMWKFDVNATTGRQYQTDLATDGVTPLCTGINQDSWIDDNKRGGSDTVVCHTEARASTAADVEDFANNQATWAIEFGAVFEKMLANGYSGLLTTTSNYDCCTRLNPIKNKNGPCDAKDVC